MSAPVATSRTSHLLCHECNLLIAGGDPTDDASHEALECPRCGSSVHHRKPNSLARTWALLIAAMICYIPANLYPVMAITSLGKEQADTILSGVFFLIHHDMWPLAVVVFIASVFVPLAKIAALIFLVTSVQLKSQWRPVDRTRLYRITETVGRWSMVDIYVVTILVALVHLGALASIAPQPGAFFFGAVVVITMFAAEGFDPRLIWDQIDDADGSTRASSGATTNGISREWRIES